MKLIVGIGVRGLMLLFSAVVLGLSVTIAKQQKFGSPPAETSFGSFTGAFGIIAAAVGVAALFFDALPGLVPLVSDGLASLFFLASGIALAVALGGVSCTDNSRQSMSNRFANKILNGGCYTIEDATVCGVFDGRLNADQVDQELKNRCVRAQADFAFAFIACVAALVSLVLTYLSRRSSNGVFA